MRFRSLLFIAGATLAGFVHAGPYAPAAGQPGSTAVSGNDPSIAGWATGYLNYLPGPNVSSTFKTPQNALGPANPSSTVSLGDNGVITLTFAGAIFNGAGADFAVFENSFSDTFLELAWVEVSSDGSHFFRFPGFSNTASPVSSFGSIDPTNIDGLAGKYRGGFGTPFDLNLLSNVPGLNVNDVRYVRIVDILGDGSVLDSLQHPIYDPTPTVDSGGFDLDAVGVMHLAAVPEPSTLALLCAGVVLLWLSMLRRGRTASTALIDPTQRG